MTEKDAQTADDALLGQIDALKSEVQARLKDPIKVQKALESMSKKGRLPTGEALTKPLRDLKRLSIETLGLDEERQALVKEVDAFLERHKMKLRMQFLSELQTMATEKGIDVVKLSETPLTLYLHPLTVEIDFDKEKASLLYAREAVTELELTPKSVLDGRQSGADEIRDQSLESTAFFDLLRQAYQLVLIARGEGSGARVDLVDLLVPLAMLRAGHADWRKKGIAALEDYPRYLLAYQLHRLRRDGMLEKDGRRIDLGTATGGSTKNKKDVLFIPSSQTEGQYYLSIRIGS